MAIYIVMARKITDNEKGKGKISERKTIDTFLVSGGIILANINDTNNWWDGLHIALLYNKHTECGIECWWKVWMFIWKKSIFGWLKNAGFWKESLLSLAFQWRKTSELFNIFREILGQECRASFSRESLYFSYIRANSNLCSIRMFMLLSTYADPQRNHLKAYA